MGLNDEFSSGKDKNKVKLTLPSAELRPRRAGNCSYVIMVSRGAEFLGQHCISNYRIFDSLAYFGRGGS